MFRKSALVLCLATCAWGVGGVAEAQMGGLKAGAPIGVLLEGYVGQGPAGETPVVRWTVKVQRETYTFTVTKLDVRTGNTSSMDIVTALDGYPVNLTFFGEQLDTFVKAAPENKLSILGSIQVGGGARYLFVSSIGVAPPAAPAAGQTP